VWLLSFDCFPLFPPLCPLFLFFYFSVLEMKGLMFLSLIVFCLLWFWDEGQQTMVMLVVNNLWFSAFFFFCRDEDNGRADLWLSSAFLSFSVYIFFWIYALFSLLFFLCSFLYFWVDFSSPLF
jgi:hypothetical protein